MLNVVTIYGIAKTSALPKPDVGVGLMVEPFFVSFFIKWLQLHNPDYIFYLGFVFVIGLFSITSFFNIMAISVDRLFAV